MKEYILCAAIHVEDDNVYPHQPHNIKSGLVFGGWRHHNCLVMVNAMFPNKYLIKNQVQGFLTNTGRFVDRYEAGKIAFECGQTIEQKNILFSEDIY